MSHHTTPVALATRFWDRLDKTGDCWLWMGYCNGDGYGVVSTAAGYLALTHRAAWALTNGPIPEGMRILHRCDNPPCCNPAHLFLGTQIDNIRDRDAKGRGRGRATHCPRGHSYADAKRDANGRRVCRHCKNASARRRRAERRDALASVAA